MSYLPVIIVGAPRSGTNMLRDVLSSFDGFATWPCDEINYIWRHGNINHPSDEIPASYATQYIKTFINNKFLQISKKYKSDVVIEKTCANSLRVPFVDEILPEAKYIFICRDGIDATGSAKERWTAGLDIPYIIEKVRYVPLSDLPYYAFRYFWSRLYRIFSKENRLAFWGPVLDNMDEILQHHSLNELCALQWKQCVDSAEQAFSNMSVEKVYRIRYEDFVLNPFSELQNILKFLGKDIDDDAIKQAVQFVSSRSLGKGRKALGSQEVEHLESLINSTLKRYDYI